MRRNVLPGSTHDRSIRASCHGSSSTAQRGAGHCSYAHSKKFTENLLVARSGCAESRSELFQRPPRETCFTKKQHAHQPADTA